MPKCSLIVDLASVEHRLADAAGRRGRVDLDLPAAVPLFTNYGLEPVELAVAMPWVPVVQGLPCNPRRARAHVDRSRRWWEEQRRRLPATLGAKVLWGSSDGSREIAVDLAVAAGALDSVSRAQQSGVDLVVLLSHDADLHGIHRYSSAVPVLVAGWFIAAEKRLLKSGRVPAIRIPKPDFQGLAADSGGAGGSSLELGRLGEGRPVPAEAGDGTEILQDGDLVLVDPAHGMSDQAVQSGPLDRTLGGTGALRRALKITRTTAVVDPYGMYNAAIDSIGVSELPDAESVRGLLESLGWDQPVAVLATVPDLRRAKARQLPKEQRLAWIRRDDQLDQLAGSFDEDADDATIATRAQLSPQGSEADPGRDVDRDRAVSEVKRLATGLLADLWLAVTVEPDADVVLLSDSAELTAALEILPHCGIDTYRNVVRVGVHAGVGRLELPGGVEPVRSPFVLLTGAQLARLVRVDVRPYGARHRQLLNAALRDDRTPIRAGGHDPETGARVVHLHVAVDTDGDGILEEHDLESLLFGVPDQLGGVRRERQMPRRYSGMRVLITFDRSGLCGHPVIRYQEGPEPELLEAKVLDQLGNWISVDLDGDGAGDGKVPLGHEALDFDPDREVGLLRCPETGLSVIDPESAFGDQLEPEVVRVEGPVPFASGLAWAAVSVEEDAGEPRPVVTPSGAIVFELERGDVLYALPRDGADGPYLVAMSTPLRHLAYLAE